MNLLGIIGLAILIALGSYIISLLSSPWRELGAILLLVVIVVIIFRYAA